MKNISNINGEVTSAKIRRLEKILDDRRSRMTLKDKIKQKEELLGILVNGFGSGKK